MKIKTNRYYNKWSSQTQNEQKFFFICGCFELGKLFDFIFAHSWLKSSLLFFEKLVLWKTFFKLIIQNIDAILEMLA